MRSRGVEVCFGEGRPTVTLTALRGRGGFGAGVPGEGLSGRHGGYFLGQLVLRFCC